MKKNLSLVLLLTMISIMLISSALEINKVQEHTQETWDRIKSYVPYLVSSMTSLTLIIGWVTYRHYKNKSEYRHLDQKCIHLEKENAAIKQRLTQKHNK
jgi:hypothetical protein